MAGGSAGEPALPQVVTVEHIAKIGSAFAASVALDLETVEGRRLRLVIPIEAAKSLVVALGDQVLDELVMIGPLDGVKG